MKKKIFGGIAILAIAAMAAFNVTMNTQNENLSDLSLANVEALAQTSGETVYVTCSSSCRGGGQCWIYFNDPFTKTTCNFNGYQWSFCSC